MLHRLIFLLGLTLTSVLSAAEFPGPGTPIEGGRKYEFPLEGHTVRILMPDAPAAGNPWLYRMFWWGAFPTAENAMLKRGWAVAWIQTEDGLGTPDDNSRRTLLYEYLTQEQGFSTRPVVFGMSLGGLSGLRWVIENPEKVCGIYLDAPVANFEAWLKPRHSRWEHVRETYGMTDEELLKGDGNPCVGVRKIAEAKVPMLLICGDSDQIVPYETNGKIVGENFRKAGGQIQEIVKPGCDHHPHGLEDPAPILEFFEKCWSEAQK